MGAAPLRPGIGALPGVEDPVRRPRARPAPAFAPGLPGRVAQHATWPPVPVALAVAPGLPGKVAMRHAGPPTGAARPPAPGLPAPEALVPAAALVPAPPALRPRPRPDATAPAPAMPATLVLVTAPAPPVSLRPAKRPDNLARRQVVAAMVPAQPDPGVIFGRKGSLCGIDAIKGTTLSPIAGKIRGCGVADPVQVTSVQGVPLSTPATMDCPTAEALNAWVKGAVLPQVGKLGGGVARLEVAASYACRPRNNQKGAKISEHGRGRAIDISGITLKNGVTLTVLKGWGDRTHGALMKALHKAACGPFGTVLGPNSDGFHRDHFHLDTAAYRSGRYCR
jgi:hypothetical protein